MKFLLILLIFLSIIMGIPTNLGNFTLFGAEISSVIGMIKTHVFTTTDYIIWISLLISHLAMVFLIFLTKKEYFKKLLVVIPLLFVTFYVMLEGVFILFLLIPFFIVWIVCLIKLRDQGMQLD